ncbi:MAG TPA: phosphoenolpyruvate synthase, partial [Sphingobacteriaceae bacterium]
IEWAKDGDTGHLYILQARPETVFSTRKATKLTEYRLAEKGEVITTGDAIGSKVAAGRARILASPAEAGKLESGDVLVTGLTSPDWDPILRKVSAIVTNKGGRTSHAAIVARELGVPAIVGTENGTEAIRDGEMITISCAEGKRGNIYRNALKWEEIEHDLSRIILPSRPEVRLIVGEPDKAFQLASYPCSGVGLMRLEFIISDYVRIHPMALVRFNELEDPEARRTIESLTQQYPDKEQCFVEKLAEGVGTIAAAFHPREVIVRMSDFKSNEYANLVGGRQFEPEEENPMLGFRGASRYYHELYRHGFRLECAAMKRVREDMGLKNVKLMIPFCRTPEEGRKVLEVMAANGLKQGEHELEVYVMAEIPSNVLLAEDFARLFDGFSIGSNDLTQLTLGIDRDSALISSLFDEENAASKAMIRMMLEKARSLKRKTGLCGQAPSDSETFARFLVETGIDSISFNPDALLKGIETVRAAISRSGSLQTV